MTGRRFEEADLNTQEFQAVRKDTPVALATNNHYSPLLIDTEGRLYVNVGGSADGVPVPSSDAGPAQEVTRTYTASADMTTAAAISPAPAEDQKIVAMDILISNLSAVDMLFDVEMETTGNILAKVPLPVNGVVPITLRGMLKGDAADKKLFGKASVAGAVSITAVTFSEE